MINLFKKTTILIIMLAVFMAPISAGIKIDKNKNLSLNVETKKILAQTETATPDGQNANAKLSTGETLELSTSSRIGYASAIFDIKVLKASDKTLYNFLTKIIILKDGSTLTPEQEKEQTVSELKFSRTTNFSENNTETKSTMRICFGLETDKCPEPAIIDTKTLKPDTDYKLKVGILKGGEDNAATYYWTFRTGNKDNNTSGTTTGDVKSYNQSNGGYFDCSWNPFSEWTCKLAAVLYYAILEPIAMFTRVAATILDFFIFYSTNSSSYDSEFIKKSWAAVRDIANIFFIIALFYVAIKTVLGLNVSNNKKLVGMVIAIGLVINFSLFTTQLVIDGTNILAKVFYNNIKPVDKKNNEIPEGKEGQKSISVGLVKQFNPQTLMTAEEFKNQQGLFIFMTILSILLMAFMIYIFLSVALLFVSRVVSLWLSMIFSPIAFASYTVPFEIPGFGHKEWWKNLIDNAMLAPIFIFFLYIIILFGDTTKLIASDVLSTPNSTQGYLDAMMKTIIPFIIIFILLKKSKEMAQKFAGEMGKAIVGGAAVLGGLALGGTAMLGATAGRLTMGKFMKSASLSEQAQKYSDPALRGSLKGFDKFKGWAGNKINSDQKHIEHAAHARHELDKATEAKYHGKKFKDLTAPEREEIKKKISRDKKGEEAYGKTYNQLDSHKKAVVDRILRTPLATGTSEGDKMIKSSKEKQTLRSSLLQATRTGSYDIRNLSKIEVKEQSKTLNKIISGITGNLASGIRGGLKGALNINYGESQKSFLKDLGHTITEALKGAKVNVDLSHVGHEEKEDAHGGHGGGGHH